MRKARLVTLLVVFVVLSKRSAFAQDRIELYADMNRTECALSEAVSPPIVRVYVWFTGPAKSISARFIVPKPACWQGATWIGDAVNPLHTSVGDSQRDWNLIFFSASQNCGPAFTPPIYVGYVNFLVSGQALPCCQIKPMPSFQYVFLDCSFGEHPLLDDGQRVTVNANPSCPCQLPVATEPATWGRVKSLYR